MNFSEMLKKVGIEESLFIDNLETIKENVHRIYSLEWNKDKVFEELIFLIDNLFSDDLKILHYKLKEPSKGYDYMYKLIPFICELKGKIFYIDTVIPYDSNEYKGKRYENLGFCFLKKDFYKEIKRDLENYPRLDVDTSKIIIEELPVIWKKDGIKILHRFYYMQSDHIVEDVLGYKKIKENNNPSLFDIQLKEEVFLVEFDDETQRLVHYTGSEFSPVDLVNVFKRGVKLEDLPKALSVKSLDDFCDFVFAEDVPDDIMEIIECMAMLESL